MTAVHTHDAVNSGPYLNGLPTGKPMHINGVEVFRIVDGKITEFCAFVQLGLIPRPG